MIIDSQPLTVAVLASIIYGESLAPAGVAGLGLGVVGLLMLELPREALAQLASGDAAGAIDAVTAGVDAGRTLGQRRVVDAHRRAEHGGWDRHGSVGVQVCRSRDGDGWHMALGGVPLLAYSIATEPEVWNNLDQLGPVEIGGLAYTSLLGGALAYGAFFYFASRGSLTKLSSLTFLTPMFAALFGYLLLDETLDEVQLAGALVTVVGIYLVNTRASEGTKED